MHHSIRALPGLLAALLVASGPHASAEDAASAAQAYASSVSKGDKLEYAKAFVAAFSQGGSPPPGDAFAPGPVSRIFADANYLENLQALTLDDERVLGGDEDENLLFPDAVAVGNLARWCCTGVLIAPDRVLTAAHCRRQGCAAARVFVGSDVTTGVGVTEQVSGHRPYKGKTGSEVDLEVLLLRNPIRPGLARPKAIAASAQVERARNVRLVGYGTTDPDGNVGYGRRRMVDVPIATTNCAAKYAQNLYGCKAGLELVAGDPLGQKDSCRGDSGGPAYVLVDGEWMLAATTSRGIRGATKRCGEGGIYVRVDKQSDWLQGVLIASAPRPVLGRGGSFPTLLSAPIP
jgi:secreted trypsin-like serine protease